MISIGLHRHLHEQRISKILRRDDKAANMLLVKNHEAVQWVFGLATLRYHGGARHITPRSISTRPTSEKANVFGSGILLLSLVTAQLAFELDQCHGLRLEDKPHFKRWGMLGTACHVGPC